MARQLVCPGTKSPHDRSERTQSDQKTALDRPSALTDSLRSSTMWQCPFGQPTGVIALRCSLGSSCRASVHVRRCARRAEGAKDAGVVRGGAEGCKIVEMAGYRARTAEPSAWPRALRSHPHRKHQTYEEGARARRERARAGRRGAGPRRWSLAAPPYSSVLLDERAIHNILFIKIGNMDRMGNRAGIPNLVSEVSCALCSAGKCVPRSTGKRTGKSKKDKGKSEGKSNWQN